MEDIGIDLKRPLRGFTFADERRPLGHKTVKNARIEVEPLQIKIVAPDDGVPVPVGRLASRLTERGIARFVALQYNVSFEDILGPTRTANLVTPRHVAMYLARAILKHSLPKIGRRLGGKDHSSVLHAVRKVAKRIHVDAGFAHDVAHMEAHLIAYRYAR